MSNQYGGILFKKCVNCQKSDWTKDVHLICQNCQENIILKITPEQVDEIIEQVKKEDPWSFE